MKGKALIPLVLGLAVGLLAVKFLVDSLKKAQAANQNSKIVTVVRARQDIDATDEIKPEMVELIEVTDNLFAPEGDRITELEGENGVIGRVAGKAIPTGVPILKSMLSPKGTQAGITGRIPAGYGAYGMKISEDSAAGYQIKPGDFVDVVVSMEIRTGNRREQETFSDIILELVEVAAVGRDQSNEQGGGGGKVKPAKSATLIVPKNEIPKLHIAATRGKVSLLLRGGEDVSREKAAAHHAKGPNPNLARLIDIINGRTEPEVEEQPSENWMANFLAQQKQQQVAQRSQKEELPHQVLIFRGPGTEQNGQGKTERLLFESDHSHNLIEVRQGGPTPASNRMRNNGGSSSSGASMDDFSNGNNSAE